ncbi:hypothetical protein FRB90_007886, partial [Tulasnella sp. 427]
VHPISPPTLPVVHLLFVIVHFATSTPSASSIDSTLDFPMDQNLYALHLYPPSHHLPQPQHRADCISYVSQPQPQPQQAYHIPPPHRPVQVVAQEPSTFDHQHLYIGPHYQPDQHFATAAEEGGLTGWVPLEEQGEFQHQPTSVTPIAGDEALIGYSNLDQTATTSTTASFHPQPGRATTSYSSLANWNALPEQQQQQHLSGKPQIDEIPGEAVAYRQQYQNLQPPVASPVDLVSGYEPQLSTGAAVARAGTLISPQVYNPAANGSVFLEFGLAYHQGHQQNVYTQVASQGDADARAQQHQSYELARPHAQTGNTVSQGQMYSPTSPSESPCQVDVYQQTPLGSPESMAILNGAIPSQHQQYALPASSSLIAPQPSYEAESQHAHASAPVHSFQPGASDSASDLIITNSSTNVTVCVQPQQPQAPAATPTRTSSLAGWADVPPTPSASIAHNEPVCRHHQQAQYHQQKVAVLAQAYAPHEVRADVPIVKSRAVKSRAPIPNQPLPVPLCSSTTTAHPRSQAQNQARPLGRSATVPDLSPPPAPQQQQPSNRLSPSRTAVEFDVSVRYIEAIKKSDHIRRAVELHVDVGNADLSSPASHKARVKA